jgi:hypothetical protein
VLLVPFLPPLSSKFSHENKLLFTFEDSTSVLEINSGLSNGLIDDVKEAIDRSGLYNLEVEFMPSVIKPFNKTDGSTVSLKNRTDESFQNWLKSVCSSLASNLYLIPDTNFLMRQYYSNYIKHYMDRDSTFLRIPRLAIIEVENIYNRKKPDNSPKENLNPNDKQKFLKNENEKAKARRRAFQAMSEILSIKHNGGDILQNLDISLLQSFAPHAGEGFADAWIRREISNNHDLRRPKFVSKDHTEATFSEIFLTCDLMGALAAVADNINTLLQN